MTVAKDALQKDIADRLTKAGEQPESVTCSEDLAGEVGKTTRCEVVMSPTNSFEPVVTVTGVDGSTINYEMTPALSKDQLENAVSRLVADAEGAQVDSASCESGLEGEVGVVASCDTPAFCTIVTGADTTSFTLTVTTVEGSTINFHYEPRG